ncbi:nucleotidyltransferase domain-containing protein [Microbacterium rhizomatis]|uniref:Nucleotidyltransferase domain-containing protein n=1 Tax=Microbacterium rhizomatis TaxID=1631477 RepID=A0A5J5J0R8_9MICO|nr:nucleotidyltransferase domain-containing protein [Microbacterium rhizomatis]KAA9107937.1 nucleotidyltransferase domain-containing protein [Microbacterium rhizomatis]
MRSIPSSLDPLVVGEIDRRLSSVSRDEGVRIPWAIESGSRAWGFPSPDSDYDCRFLFVRARDDYLSLWPARDVIETPLDKIYDVNGWDITKAAKLIAKGNATVIEWLRSPIVYTGETSFRDELLALADAIVERGAIGRHYLHVAVKQRGATPTLKRFFYGLRPAVALRWLETHPTRAVPPMDLPTLLAESDVGEEVHRAALDLIALKAETRELGNALAPAVLERFVVAQLEHAEHFETEPVAKGFDRTRSLADAFIRTQLDDTRRVFPRDGA